MQVLNDDDVLSGGRNAVPCASPNGYPEPTDRSKAIVLYSLNNAPLIPEDFYIAYQVEPGVYVTHNQAVFLEFL